MEVAWKGELVLLDFILRFLKKPFVKILASIASLLPLFILGCSSSRIEGTKTSISELNPAEPEEMVLYRNIGMSYFCIARQAEVDFPKAIAIASTNFAAIIEKKHDGLIKEVGDKKLTRDQIYKGTYFQLVEGVLQICPDKVPDEIKAKYKDALKEIKDSQ